MKKIEKFNDFLSESTDEGFVAVGFGTPNSAASWSTAALRNNTSGYELTPIAGNIKDLGQGIAQQAVNYETSANPDESGVGYIKEAKSMIGDHIDECYQHALEEHKENDSGKKVNEEYVEIINIDDALEDMKNGWEQWKNGPLTEPSDIRPAAKEFKAYITGWLNKNIK